MTRWQYLTAPLMVHATQRILDNFGQDGWELVQVVSGPTGGLVAYFKRPVEEDRSEATASEGSNTTDAAYRDRDAHEQRSAANGAEQESA